jgi:hypothetical protein
MEASVDLRALDILRHRPTNIPPKARQIIIGSKSGWKKAHNKAPINAQEFNMRRHIIV